MMSNSVSPQARLPSWFRQEIPDAKKVQEMREVLRATGLGTVCEGARCPNSGKCWSAGAVTVMILGDACTRCCGFCAVPNAVPQAVDPSEPGRVADLVEKLNLRYVVVTSVTRDDLEDGGAEHFFQTVRAIRRRMPQTKIEVLIPDFGGIEEGMRKVVDAGPEVVGHNIEMARRLFSRVRPQANYDRSLEVLRRLKRLGAGRVKSGFMVGLGETDDEVQALLADLADAGCDIVTIGQYLAPSRQHLAVERFVAPEMFVTYQEWGEAAGIPGVVSGPLVRSSYLAEDGFSRLNQHVVA